MASKEARGFRSQLRGQLSQRAKNQRGKPSTESNNAEEDRYQHGLEPGSGVRFFYSAESAHVASSRLLVFPFGACCRYPQRIIITQQHLVSQGRGKTLLAHRAYDYLPAGITERNDKDKSCNIPLLNAFEKSVGGASPYNIKMKRQPPSKVRSGKAVALQYRELRYPN
ncbi:predicted protein [Histoplasma capsulatum var. duboisii H88]|uniref:Predicted protein n=1 Tax=Ajellomyces capsulatus (strain H88) TaxID=544711 RepID=F0UGJ0_AJEC8|nr:predicted protein [Histoplasma capsulatum var. duboisii H88]